MKNKIQVYLHFDYERNRYGYVGDVFSLDDDDDYIDDDDDGDNANDGGHIAYTMSTS